MSDPLTGLVKKIDEKVHEASGKHKNKLGTFVIIGNADGRADQLRELAQRESLQRVTLCIGAAPPRYEVNPEADVTVVIYNPGRPGQQRVQRVRPGRDADRRHRRGPVRGAAEVKPLRRRFSCCYSLRRRTRSPKRVFDHPGRSCSRVFPFS